MMLRNKSKWKLCFPTRLLHITFFGGFLDRKRHLIPKNLKKIDVGSAGGFGVNASRNSVLAKLSLPVRKSFHGVAVYF